MSLTASPTAILSFPAVYRVFTRLIGGNVWRKYLDEYVQPRTGEKVLDIGCGPADILNFLPEVRYTGVDISEHYIEAANKKFGEKGRFLCGDVGTVTIEQERGTFGLVLSTGVLHHLDDDRAAKLFDLASVALAPEGRLITYDGCYLTGQSPIAKWLLRRDRGKFVRTPERYQSLAAQRFSRVRPNVRHDLLRVPYTHLIMNCSNPAN